MDGGEYGTTGWLKLIRAFDAMGCLDVEREHQCRMINGKKSELDIGKMFHRLRKK